MYGETMRHFYKIFNVIDDGTLSSEVRRVNGTGKIEGVKGTIKGFVREGFHLTVCVALGCTGYICKKER